MMLENSITAETVFSLLQSMLRIGQTVLTITYIPGFSSTPCCGAVRAAGGCRVHRTVVTASGSLALRRLASPAIMHGIVLFLSVCGNYALRLSMPS
jgi:hypothetical protein